ncbi:DUF6049 family protein [Diaminobutyricimonas sp. LJ205]|uniref:DUF6049 family protein n=1 Tax=Diaminobutyricimonas sp. LJ205 TaxID=2683590 RepID=UPI0012F47846|nr:DUF6049 family protein [Diaminobutyricimonas sp. LJ205]
MKPLRAVLALVLGLAGIGATSFPAASAPLPDVPIDLAVAVESQGILRPATDLRVVVTIGNGGSTTLNDASASVHLANTPADSPNELAEWFQAEPDSDEDAGRELARVDASGLSPRSSTQLVVTVPAASIPITAPTTEAYALAVRLNVAGETVAEERNAIVWHPEPVSPAVGVGIIVPLVIPQHPDAMIDAATLAAATGPVGLLSRELNAAIGSPAALAVDPMILASIRVLGSDAPPSALEWLSRLETAPNDKFTLGYADSDLTLPLQAGAGAPVGVESFDFALNPSRFQTPTPAPTTPGTPAPVPEQTLPTTEQLMALPGSIGAIAWPGTDSVTTADLPPLAAAGYQTLLLSSGNLEGEDGRSHVTAGGADVLVVQQRMSAILDNAVQASSTLEWQQEMNRLSAVLASAATSGTTSVLGALDREVGGVAQRLTETLATLGTLPWVQGTALSTMLATEATAATLVEMPQSAERVMMASSMLQAESADAGFATAAADPSLITAERRLDLLTALSLSWGATADDLKAPAGVFLETSEDLLGSVAVAEGGQILLLADRSNLQISVRNDLPQPVTVRLTTRAMTAGLAIEDPVIDVTLEPESQRDVAVPVQSVSNGDVPVRVSLTSPTGVTIGDPLLVPVNVQAGWETAGTIAVAVLLVLVFGIGITRNILKRRKQRQEADVAATTTPGVADV